MTFPFLLTISKNIAHIGTQSVTPRLRLRWRSCRSRLLKARCNTTQANPCGFSGAPREPVRCMGLIPRSRNEDVMPSQDSVPEFLPCRHLVAYSALAKHSVHSKTPPSSEFLQWLSDHPKRLTVGMLHCTAKATKMFVRPIDER